MRRISPVVLAVALVLFSAVTGFYGYYADARADAGDDAPYLARYAARLAAERQGPEDLGIDSAGAGRAAMLLAIVDPGAFFESGADLDLPGTGKTRLSEAVAGRLAFETYRPGIATLRRNGYARGLEQRLTKRQLLTLWLESVEMGEGPDGPRRGFFATSRAVYGKAPAALSDAQFVRLAAVAIAPRRFRLEGRDTALDNRVRRIERLLARACRPEGRGDVWLEGCAGI